MSRKSGFTMLSSIDANRTLAAKLIGTADRIRDLHTKFGGRLYRVSIIRTRWSGGERSIGTNEIVFEREILPTPLVADLSSLSQILEPVGLNESGALVVSEISGRFTEEELQGLDDKGNQPDADENVFYEIEFLRRDGKSSIKRRFTLRASPSYDTYRFQWTITLEQTDQNRTRIGDLR